MVFDDSDFVLSVKYQKQFQNVQYLIHWIKSILSFILAKV